ncbi:restriction endonuclease [uncultured Methanobrevibacter sp.]|uniref:restriction endonuclease n=1 Tax=uncultured Methanobrevibacter sp. TaxID=253161 RepID=UPI0025FCB707|nr:restriction endonuclease [uncultured Methanobrevibacter sp.]
MKNMWMVRAGKDAFLIDAFKHKNIVCLGWCLGDLKGKSEEDIKRLMQEHYPDESKNTLSIASSQVIKFRYKIVKGDYVLSYNPSSRKYLVGEITSDYYYSEELENEDIDYIGGHNDTRDVKWLGEVSRDNLSVSTKNTLGAILTLFNINEEAQKDILDVLNNNKSPIDEEDEPTDHTEVSILKDDIKDKSIEFIKDRVNQLDPYQMQDLVAGLLRAMGYKTIVSPQGPDRGKDVIASPDGLGLEDPVIFVEVKHRKNTSMGSQDIRSFKGALKKTNRGIYVSTGGFTTDAKYEAERSEIPIILMDLDRLVKFIIQYYDNFDNDARSLIPLTKIYWPL